MTDEPFRILTVCIGNMCRSPLAERLLALRLAETASPSSYVVSSAGTGAPVGRAMEELATGELTRLGGDATGHAARRLTGDIAGETDLVLTATRDIRTAVLQEQPRAMRRAFTLVEFAELCGLASEQGATHGSARDLVAWAAAHRSLTAGVELDVDDPIGQSPEVHRDVADRIDHRVRQIADALAPLL